MTFPTHRGRPGQRMTVGKFRPHARQRPVSGQPDTEHVAAGRRFAHRLFRRHVTQRSGAAGVDRHAGRLGDPEIAQPRVQFPEQHHVLRLDVAVDDAVFVGGGGGVDQLRQDVMRVLERHPTLQPVVQRLLCQRRDDHEISVDERRIADRQDVGVVQPHRHLRLAAELVDQLLRHVPVDWNF